MQVLKNRILSSVSKPVRYIGKEWNSVYKDHSNIPVKFALCFPDVYEIGMSYLGLQIIYHLINSLDFALCERVFAPGIDMEERLRREKIPLWSLESFTPLSEFDFLGFSLNYELSFSNVLNILDLSGIPFYANERDLTYPLIIGGGSCSYNPEPIADFFDFFILGEGEEIILEILRLYYEWKGKRANKPKSYQEKITLLKEFSRISGIYVPSFYKVEYKEKDRIKKISPLNKDIPSLVNKRIVSDLNNAFYPTKPIVPFIATIHDRINLEIFRGCPNSCAYCQAGRIYRPVRMRSVNTLFSLARQTLQNTGYEEISLLSLTTSDYPYLEELVELLVNSFRKFGVSISLPSLRPDSFRPKFIQKIAEIKKTGLTLVPEAGTSRLRRRIGKRLNEENFYQGLDAALSLGWRRLKLYFMIGLPSEKEEDVKAIVDMVREILKISKKKNLLKLGITISSFVPKSHTPFQWEAQLGIEEIKEKQDFLRKNLHHPKINLKLHHPYLSFLEGVFSRGDRRLSKVLLLVQKLGERFSAWPDYFRFDLWQKAFALSNLDPYFYLRERDEDEIFPWSHLSCGVEGSLKKEREILKES